MIETILVFFALLIRTFAYEPFHVGSGAMLPTLPIGETLIVSKFSYGYSRYSPAIGSFDFEGRVFGAAPERGDLAVFRRPADVRVAFIKRVIGLPGDTVETRGGVLLINGTPVERERRADAEFEGIRFSVVHETLPNGVGYDTLDCAYFKGTNDCIKSPVDDAGPFKVPAGHYFVMGDNRDNSADSRFPASIGTGFVPEDNFIGRVSSVLSSRDGG